MIASATPRIANGSHVVIKHTNGMQARVVEFRGALGPEGTHIYRLRFGSKSRPRYVEVREDQIEWSPVESRSRSKVNSETSIADSVR